MKIFCFLFISISFLMLVPSSLEAQPEPPPRSITVTPTQSLHFGTFSLLSLSSGGGTVTVDWQGYRSSTGDVVLLPLVPTHTPAIFEIKLCQGRNVVITYSPTAILTGSNGGLVNLIIGPTEKGPSGSSFTVNADCNFVTQLRVGGTLIVGNNSANPGGFYSGSFTITFNQQ
jgi:hypothetical protein